MIAPDEQVVAARVERYRQRRRACHTAVRVGLAGLALLALAAIAVYAFVGSIPIWLNVAWGVVLTGLAAVWFAVMFTPCPRCGRDPHRLLAGYSMLSSACKVCGTQLSPEREHESAN